MWFAVFRLLDRAPNGLAKGDCGHDFCSLGIRWSGSTAYEVLVVAHITSSRGSWLIG